MSEIADKISPALSKLVEQFVPEFSDEDGAAYEARLDRAYEQALQIIEEYEISHTGPSNDVAHASDQIVQKLTRNNTSPDQILRYQHLYSRLLAEPVLKHKAPVLQFLLALADTESVRVSPTATSDNQEDQQHNKHDSNADHVPFKETFASAGLPHMMNDSHIRSSIGERPISRHKKDKRAKSAQPTSPTTLPHTHTYITYENAQPSEAALLRDLPFVFQGLSSTNLSFVSPKSLQLPKTLPVPIIGLLHALAEPGLLYKSLLEFVESDGGGLVGQSFKSALEVELRSYLQLVASLEGQIRKSMTQIDENQHGQGIVKASVTLKKCLVWTREATMGLRLMSVMTEKCSKMKGGQIISIVHSFALNHGDPFVTSFAQRLLGKITQPFYNMLKQWIYDGEFTDLYLEFFVAEQNQILSEDRGGATSVWEDKYKLLPEAIPSIMTQQFANKVFLIGKSLNFIRHGCNDSDWVQSFSRSSSKDLRWGDDIALESSIDEAYKATMARLIYLMETKFHLFQHLTALKKYILLGAGDFISVLMESLSTTLDNPANTQARHILTAQLEHAIRSSNAQYESTDVLRRLDSRMLELSHGEIGWDVFTLEYKVTAPVDVIVTPYASKQYLKVFNFLWRVKRVEFALGSIWRRCMTGARGVIGAVEDVLGDDWKLARCAIAEMIHFINQLQYYILFEVIEHSWTDLLKAMRKPDCTLDDLISAHAAYLNAITRRGLLSTTSADFPSQLHELLKIMLAYRDAVDNLYSASVAEFTKRQGRSARAHSSNSGGKWGISEVDDNSFLNLPSAVGAQGSSSSFQQMLPLENGKAMNDADILSAQRVRLRDLADRFRKRVAGLLGDLMTQKDSDMRWLAMVMNFNDVYQPLRRKKKLPPNQTPATSGSTAQQPQQQQQDSQTQKQPNQSNQASSAVNSSVIMGSIMGTERSSLRANRDARKGGKK